MAGGGFFGGRGGRGRQIPARIEGEPRKLVGTSEAAAWLEGRQQGAPSPSGDPTKQPGQPGVPSGYETSLVAPAQYWSLGVLRPTNSTLVEGSWRVTYSASGGDIITSSAGKNAIRTPQGAVTIITGWWFWAEISAIGGPNAFGALTLAPDNLAYGSVNLTFQTGTNSPQVTHHTLTGGKDVPGIGSGFFNQGQNRPTELYVPGNTVLVARYTENAPPRIDIVNIGFSYEGWLIDQNLFYEYVDGPSR